MKKGLQILSALAFLTLTVGCNKKPAESANPSENASTSESVVVNPSDNGQQQSLNLMDKLADNGDGIYNISGDATKTITYTKTDTTSWSYLIAQPTDIDLSTVVGLKVGVSGSGTILVKVESSAGSAEITLKLTSSTGTYVWALSNDKEKEILAGENVKVLIFGLPGAVSGDGTIELANFEFVDDFADSDYVVQSGFTNISATISQYDGVSPTFDFNQTWSENDANTYEVSYANGEATVNYKVISYQFMVSQIQGNQHGKFEYITLKIKGTAGDTILVKTENGSGAIAAKEEKFTLTGNDDVFTFDLSSYDLADRGLINKILIFAAPGCEVSTSGTFTIKGAYFTSSWEGSNQQAITYKTNAYDGKANSFGCNEYWHDNGDKCYEITTEASPWVVNYTNVGEWSSLTTQVSGKLGNFARIKFGVSVEEGKTIMIKAGTAEVTVTGTGAYDDTNVLDLSTMTVEERNAIKNIYIFAEPGTAGVSGQFEIHWMSFDGFTAQGAVPVEYNGYGRFANMTASNFEGLDAGVYGINEGVISYEKVAGQEWSCAVAELDGDFSAFTSLEYSLVIPEGHSVLLKAEGTGGNKEATIAGSADGSAVSGKLDLSDIDTSKLTKVVLFADPNVAPATGSFTIKTLRFADIKGTTVGTDGAMDMTAGVMFDLGDSVYDVTHNENGSYTVATKEGKGDWSCFGIRVAAPSGYTKATLTVSGAAADSLLFKAENDLGGGAAETKLEALGEHATVTLDLTNTLASNPETILFVFFANPGSSTVPSEITIESIVFSN